MHFFYHWETLSQNSHWTQYQAAAALRGDRIPAPHSCSTSRYWGQHSGSQPPQKGCPGGLLSMLLGLFNLTPTQYSLRLWPTRLYLLHGLQHTLSRFSFLMSSYSPVSPFCIFYVRWTHIYLLLIYCAILLLLYCIVRYFQLLCQEPTSPPGHLFLKLRISFFSSEDFPEKRKHNVFM